eukprot:948798-Prymnesium_polylepis.1
MTLLRGLDPSVKLPPWPMRTACAPFAGLSGASSDAALLSAMAAAAGVLYNASDTLKCLELPADPNYDGIWDYRTLRSLLIARPLLTRGPCHVYRCWLAAPA